MKEICVIGAGSAGLTLIDRIREKNSQCRITLIDKALYYFSKKDLIQELSIKKCQELKSWAQEKKVDFICDCVERINLKRRKIYFKENQVRDFDDLVIATGLKSKKMLIKGEHREGFFYLSEINPFKLKELMKTSSDAAIYVSTILGCRLALSLNAFGKEVKVISDNWDFLAEDKERFIALFKDKNVSVYLGAAIEETIGEAVVRAIKISPLKVFSSQLVFVDSGFLPNCDFFEEEICMRDIFFTNYEGVYFLGDVNSPDIGSESFFIYNYMEVKKQGVILADFILDGVCAFFERQAADKQAKKDVIDSLLSFKTASSV